jgi:hypothetical protein
MDTKHRMWLDGLKPGDEVAISSNHHLTQVVRRRGDNIITGTPGQTTEWSAKTGKRRGKIDQSLVPVTEKHLEARERSKLASRLRAFDRWESLPLETLRQILALAEPGSPKMAR